VAALTALGNATLQLKAYIHRVLNVSFSREEIVEVVIQMAVNVGFPAVLNRMTAAKDIFQQDKTSHNGSQ
jgi:4-carboxymuconolactone decarboxylase